MAEPQLTQQPTSSEYDELPPSVQQYYTRGEYLWLSDRQKAELVRSETEPEEE